LSELGDMSGRVGNTVCRRKWNQPGKGKKIESERDLQTPAVPTFKK
jgi:hypothetical protein